MLEPVSPRARDEPGGQDLRGPNRRKPEEIKLCPVKVALEWSHHRGRQDAASWRAARDERLVGRLHRPRRQMKQRA
jgi:hypothetical protein